MVVLSAKFTNLMVFYLYSYNPSISINLASTSSAVLYNSMESRQPWGTQRLNRRPLVLILDSILVYVTSDMQLMYVKFE